MRYETELNAALEATERACRIILDRYGRFQQIPDAPASITTEADRESQEAILGFLHQVFPDDALCAEEATATLAQGPRAGRRLWIVDPIDGTRGFARKNGEFSVMVAFVEEGQSALGIVAEPALRRLTYATRAGGCWQRDGEAAAPRRCQVTPTTELSTATLTQSRSHHGKPSREVELLRPAHVVETYSAGIKLALVARGEVDLYVNDYPSFSDWDICAGHILVAEAGGKVSGLKGEALRYGKLGAAQTHGLLATNGMLHATALERLSHR